MYHFGPSNHLIHTIAYDAILTYVGSPTAAGRIGGMNADQYFAHSIAQKIDQVLAKMTSGCPINALHPNVRVDQEHQ